MANIPSETPSIVGASDLHFLQAGAWKHRGIVGDAEDVFRQIVDFCCDRHAKVLALAGDIMDAPKQEAKPVQFFNEQLIRLQDHGIKIIYILGNHDGDQEWASVSPGRIHLHEKMIEVDGLTIYGLDNYRKVDEFLAEYAKLQANPPSFLLCHQAVRELTRAGKDELALADLPFALDQICGDYHRHEVVEYTARDGSTGMLLSPGSTHPRDVTEDDTKAFFAIYRDQDGQCTFQSIPLKTRPVRRYVVKTQEEADAFLARKDLPLDGEGIERAVIDVSYYGDIDGFGARLANALEDRCHLFPRKRDRDRDERMPSAVARQAVAAHGLLGAVDLVTEPGPVRDSAKRLVAAIDCGIELRTMHQEFYSTPSEPGGSE